MSMPQIPEEKYRPDVCEVTIDILKSIALEETALAQILHSEGLRCQAIACRYDCCRDVSLDELIASAQQAQKMLGTIIMKEWLLLQTMQTACEIYQKISPKCTKNDRPRCQCQRC